MSDILRRLNKVTDSLEALKEPSGVDFNELFEEERNLYWLDVLVKIAKMQDLIPTDFESPITESVEQIRNKLKQPDKIYSPRWSEDEMRKRIMRLKDIICADNKMKAIWEYYIKEIAYPF